MNATKAIFLREFGARRQLLVLAFAVMTIAVLMPLVPGTGNDDPSVVRSVTSQVLALGLGLCVAVGLGISVFGTDLSAGRLGFYFARPVTARTIWIGKILASLAVVFACEGVVILPALMAERAQLADIDLQGWLAILCTFVLLPTLLFLLSHAVGVMGRARTPWLVLDLVGLIMCVVGSWLAIRPLYALGAPWAVFVVGAVLALAIAIAIAVAGCVGLAAGRSDLRRTHGAMSLSLWALTGAVVVGLWTYSGWLRSFGPFEMDDVEVFSVSPDGRWVEVWGGARWRLDVRRRVLASTSTEQFIVLPESWIAYHSELVYSADGRAAVGLEVDDRTGKYGSMWWIGLTEDAPKPVRTALVVPYRTIPALSPDGSRVAFLEGGTLSVYDLASEQLVAAFRLPDPLRRATVLFPVRNIVRLYASFGVDEVQELRIAEADISSREITETGRVSGVAERPIIVLDAAAERMILDCREPNASVMTETLRDARDGTLIRDLLHGGFTRFLADGRLVSQTESHSEEKRLTVESAAGTTRVEYPLGRVDWMRLGGEALPGQVVVGYLEHLEFRLDGRRYDLIDLESGETRPIAAGLRNSHLGFQTVWGGGGMILWSVDAPQANRIFTDRTGAVVRWDPETGQLIHIVGGTD